MKSRLGQHSTGFGSSLKSSAEHGDLYAQVSADDLHRFGLIPEFIGRLPVLTSVKELTESDLVRVLVEPENSLVTQYCSLFELDGIDLHFTDGAIHAIARMARERGTGARALSSIMEAVLKETMFEVPSQPDVRSVTITEEVVNQGAKPTLLEAVPRSKTA